VASNKLNKAKCDRLFGITHEFWESRVWCKDYLPEYEYKNNAHPYQEYLTDLKVQRVFIKEQMERLLNSNIVDQIDRAIEKIEPLAIDELLGRQT